MSDIAIERQQLSDMDLNLIRAVIYTEAGCDIQENEYSLFIAEIVNGQIGKDDYDLIEECIMEEHGNGNWPEEGWIDVVLEETGEWEDVFWHKYYEVKTWIPHDAQ